MIEVPEPQKKTLSPPRQAEVAATEPEPAAEQEPDVEMKAATVDDGEKEVTAVPSTESMDVEIVGVTAAAENDVKSEHSDTVKLDDESSEKDRDKKRDSEESGERSWTVNRFLV